VTLVYPSANHTRFRHSLGVYYLADEALSPPGESRGQQAERVRAAAILHDVGHSPYSHNIEELVFRETGLYHDDVDELLGTGDVARVLSEHGLNPDSVAGLVAGEGELGRPSPVNSTSTGWTTSCGTPTTPACPTALSITSDWSVNSRFVDGDLVLDEGNVQTAESLLLARALMNPTVYQHHVARIAKSMLRRATERLLAETQIEAADLRRWDDSDLLVALRECEATADLARRLESADAV